MMLVNIIVPRDGEFKSMLEQSIRNQKMGSKVFVREKVLVQPLNFVPMENANDVFHGLATGRRVHPVLEVLQLLLLPKAMMKTVIIYQVILRRKMSQHPPPRVVRFRTV
jgi:hypothetical protein